MVMKDYGIDGELLHRLNREEQARFRERTPKSQAMLARGSRVMPAGVPMAWMAALYSHPSIYVAEGQGAYFADIDANRYLDMNSADLAATLGFAPEPVVAAVAKRVGQGTAFLLPTEDALIVAELLAQRTGMPYWQFTGSASNSNTEVMRIARLATGRDKILVFEGKYHGHIDEGLVSGVEGANADAVPGLPLRAKDHSRAVPFNDLAALERALAKGDIACLIAEPMMTNCNIVFPDPGFWTAAADLVRRAGALLIIDEAHTHSFAFGGLTREWDLKPDMLVLGKGLGSGIAFGAYGLSPALAELCVKYLDGVIGAAAAGLPVGGTTYANALAMAAARAALEECLRPEDYARTAELGERLALGLGNLFSAHGRDWRAPQIGGRTGWILFPELPRNGAEAYRSLDREFVDLRRVFMANRGVWEAVWSAGPAAGFAHVEADIDRYLEVADAFLGAVRG